MQLLAFLIKYFKQIQVFIIVLLATLLKKSGNKNGDLKKELKIIKENEKFQEKLDSVSVDDKRKFLRDKFGER